MVTKHTLIYGQGSGGGGGGGTKWFIWKLSGFGAYQNQTIFKNNHSNVYLLGLLNTVIHNDSGGTNGVDWICLSNLMLPLYQLNSSIQRSIMIILNWLVW